MHFLQKTLFFIRRGREMGRFSGGSVVFGPHGREMGRFSGGGVVFRRRLAAELGIGKEEVLLPVREEDFVAAAADVVGGGAFGDGGDDAGGWPGAG